MMEAVRTSETLDYTETARQYIPEGCHHTRRRENLKSHTVRLELRYRYLHKVLK
jgi:hypothetical protein